MEQSSLDKLFYKPSVERDEPAVERSEANIEEIAALSVSYKQEIINELTDIAVNFDNVVLEYDKILNVLIRRADILGIKINISELSKSDPAVANAARKLYGSSSGVLTYSHYVDLVKSESSIASMQTQGPYYSQLTSSITSIKNEFSKEFSANNAEILSSADTILYASSIAAINKAATVSAIDSLKPKSVDESKLKKIFDDCFPCMERVKAEFENYTSSDVFKRFIESLYNTLVSNYSDIYRLKAMLCGGYFIPTLCRMYDVFRYAVCLPDLVALESLYKLLELKYKKLLDTTYPKLPELNVLQPAGMISTFLVQLWDLLWAPLDCVSTSISYELEKIKPLYSGREVTRVINDYNQFTRKATVNLRNIINEYIDLLTSLYGKYKESDYNVFSAHEDLGNVRGLTAFIGEVISVITMDSSGDKSLYKTICEKTLNKTAPWLKLENGTETGTSTGGDTGRTNGGNTGGSGDDDETIYVTDISLGDDFFDDGDGDFNRFNNLLSKTKFRDSIENGPDVLRPDFENIQKYKDFKEFAKAHKSLTSVVPVSYIDNSSCLSPNDEYNLNQINNWINRLASNLPLGKPSGF